MTLPTAPRFYVFALSWNGSLPGTAAFWSSFHSRLIVAIADAIEPQLGPQYYVEVETRIYSE